MNVAVKIFGNKRNVMWALMFCFLISCGVHSKLPKELPATNAFVSTLPIYHEPETKPKQIDTVKRKHYKPDPIFQEKLNHLIDRSDKAFNNIDEILAINIEWQKRYMRLADTARHRKQAKDSVYALVSALRDTVNAGNKRVNAFQNEARKAGFYQDQNKKYSNSINWQTWAGFAIIVAFFIANQIAIRRLHKKHNINLTTL